jgi:hypothetical protein
MKWLVSLLLLASVASVVPCASAQSVTLTTPNDPVGDVVETTQDALGDAPSPGSLGSATDGLAGTDGSAVDSRADSTSAAPGKAFRTRFDRLRPRLERLLERIELGENVRANLRRLEQALLSLSAHERARLLRFLNAEIRRLRANGTSSTERRRVDRLRRAREAITTRSAPTPGSAIADASAATRATGPARGTDASFAGQVLAASARRSALPPTGGATPPRGGAPGPSEPSGLPEFPLIEVLLALCAVLFVILVGLAIKEERTL